MSVSIGLIIIGLCHERLLSIIDEGLRPPEMINLAIMANSGATISMDAMAQANNYLTIIKGFAE